MTCLYHVLIRIRGDDEERNQWNVGGCFILAIKHELVAFSHDELDRMVCKVDQGQWKPGNMSLFGVLCSWNHCCLYHYYVGSARVLSFVHRLTVLDITVLYVEPGSFSSVCWVKVFFFIHRLTLGFPYANHIRCVFALGEFAVNSIYCIFQWSVVFYTIWSRGGAFEVWLLMV